MRSAPTALLALLALSLVGCPHVIYAVSTLLNEEPRFPAPGAAAPTPELVPIRLDLATEGHFLLYYLRVDGKVLAPSAGPCRRWFLRPGAQETTSAPGSFCDDDEVRFRVAAGVLHRIELQVGSVHTVAKRVLLEYTDNLRWRLPISTVNDWNGPPGKTGGTDTLPVDDFRLAARVCQTSGAISSPINGSNNTANKLKPGSVIAVKTSAGRYAKLRIETYGYNLGIRWVTYK